MIYCISKNGANLNDFKEGMDSTRIIDLSWVHSLNYNISSSNQDITKKRSRNLGRFFENLQPPSDENATDPIQF